jgi:UrcA family protein
MFNHAIRNALFASLGTILAIGAAPASAAAVEKFTSEVRYGDINLTSDAGVAQLQRRITNAARKICGYADARDLNGSQAVAACRRAAISAAAPKVELAVAGARNGQKLAANAAIGVGTPASR